MKPLTLFPTPPPEGVQVHPNCARCMALCCHYVSQEVDPPTTAKDFDTLRWNLMHPGVRVFVDQYGDWFLQFESRCRFLGSNNLCSIYETRPQICRDLSPEGCEFALGPGDRHYFTTLEEFDRWLGERERKRKGRGESDRSGTSPT